jgi:hypothetical protein
MRNAGKKPTRCQEAPAIHVSEPTQFVAALDRFNHGVATKMP